MTTPQIGIYDAYTDTWEYRDMNAEELEALAKLPEPSNNTQQTTTHEGDTMPHMVGE